MSDAARTGPDAAAAGSVPTGIWEVDPKHSTVGFHVKHMGIAKVRGRFNRFAGRVEVTADSIVASGTVDATSVDSNEDKRDAHLRSPDFFDVENHPQLTFASTSIEPSADGVRIRGDLTMRGVTREVELLAAIGGTGQGKIGGTRLALEVTGELNRADWEMTFNTVLPGGNVLVSDRVWLTLSLEALEQ